MTSSGSTGENRRFDLFRYHVRECGRYLRLFQCALHRIIRHVKSIFQNTTKPHTFCEYQRIAPTNECSNSYGIEVKDNAKCTFFEGQKDKRPENASHRKIDLLKSNLGAACWTATSMGHDFHFPKHHTTCSLADTWRVHHPSLIFDLSCCCVPFHSIRIPRCDKAAVLGTSTSTNISRLAFRFVMKTVFGFEETKHEENVCSVHRTNEHAFCSRMYDIKGLFAQYLAWMNRSELTGYVQGRVSASGAKESRSLVTFR